MADNQVQGGGSVWSGIIPAAPQAAVPAAQPSGGPAPGKYEALIYEVAKKYNVEPGYIRSSIRAESSWNPNAVNAETNATGLAQAIPDTARRYGIDPKDPAQSIELVARMTRESLDRHKAKGRTDDPYEYASNEYHGGTNDRNWGPKTAERTRKVLEGWRGESGGGMVWEGIIPRAQNETPLWARDPAPVKEKPKDDYGYLDAGARGLSVGKLTWDFAADSLAKLFGADRTETQRILGETVRDYAALKSDPKMEAITNQVREASKTSPYGPVIGAIIALPKAVYDAGDPISTVGHFMTEQIIPSLPGFILGAGAGAAFSRATMEKLVANELVKKGMTVAAAGAAGNAMAVVTGALGSNYAEGLKKNGGDPVAAREYAVTKTLAEIPANAAAGALMGVKIGPNELINILAQSVVQGTGGAVGAAQASHAVGEKADPAELALEFWGEFASAPVEAGQAGLAHIARKDDADITGPLVDIAARRPGEAPPVVSPQPPVAAVDPVAAGASNLPGESNGMVAGKPPGSPTIPDAPPLPNFEVYTGAESRIITPAGQPVDTQFAVADADSLTTSYTPMGEENRNYGLPVGANRVDQINLDPERVAESTTSADGAPIVGNDGRVESGNNRINGIRRAYHTQAGTEYKAWLLNNLQRFGIPESSRAAIEAMERPALVRLRTSPVDRAQFVNDSNQKPGMSNFVPPGANPPGPPGTPPPGGGMQLRDDFEMQRQVRALGALLPGFDGLNVPATPFVRGMVEGLSRAAPVLQSTAFQNGDSMAADIALALADIASIKSQGLDVAEVLAQIELLGEQYSPEVVELIYSLDEAAGNPDRVQSLVEGYAKSAATNPTQSRMEQIRAEARALREQYGRLHGPTPTGAATTRQPAGGGEGEAAVAGAEELPGPREARGQEAEGVESTRAAEPKADYERQLQKFLRDPADPSQSGEGVAVAREEAVAAVGDLHATGSVLAESLSRDFAEKQRTSLVGHVVETPLDLAILAQVYRDPRFETFRIFFADKDGKITSQLGITSRLPGSTAAMIGEDVDAYLTDVLHAAEQAGAAKYWLVHNHPSGISTPSHADEVLTGRYARNWLRSGRLQFGGHVVIDTNEYSVIEANGNNERFAFDFGAEPHHPEPQATIAGPKDLVNLVKAQAVDDGSVTLFGATYQNRVVRVATLSAEEVAGMTRDQAKALMLRRSMSDKTPVFFAASRDIKALHALVKVGAIVDGIHITPDGGHYSLADQGLAGGEMRLLPRSRRARLSPDTSEQFEFLRERTYVPIKEREKAAEPGAKYGRDDQTKTVEFKRWFGDWEHPKAFSSRYPKDLAPVSAAVNEDGSPRVFYHTTKSDFAAFESGRKTTNSGTFGDWDTERSGIFFSPALQDSEAYGKRDGRFADGANVMPVFLQMRAPLDLTKGIGQGVAEELAATGHVTERFVNNRMPSWEMFDGEDGRAVAEAVKAAGYDSVIFNDENPDSGESFEAHVVFEPTQVKSAIGNSGSFDPRNPDIRFSRSGAGGTIDVDGIQRPRTNSDGKSIAQDDEALHNFWKWFGDSKVVDDQGRPLVVYHGSSRGDISQFFEGGHFGDSGQANDRLRQTGQYGVVYPVYMRAENPARMHDVGDSRAWDRAMDRASSGGHDSIVYRNDTEGAGRDSWLVWDPTQIKSATANRGTFDPKNPDIRFSHAGRRGAPVKVRDVEAVIAEFTARAKGLPKVNVLQSDSDKSIPKALRDAIAAEPEGTIAGAYHEGQIYLFADNLRNADHATFTFLHEAGHHGLAMLLGTELDAVLMKIWKDNASVQLAASKMVAQHGMSRVQAVNEVLADWAGEGRHPTILQSLVAAIRDVLRKVGIRLRMNDADVLAIVARAKRQWQKGDTRFTHTYSAFSEKAPAFYSQMAQVVAQKGSTGTGLDWRVRLNAWAKAGAIKADELQWSGLLDWLGMQQGKVTTEQVTNFIRENGVRVEEVTLGAGGFEPEPYITADDIRVEPEGDDHWFVESKHGSTTRSRKYAPTESDAKAFGVKFFNQRIDKRNAEARSQADNSKYADWQLPGGTNYREVLLTLPDLRPLTNVWRSAQEQFGNDDPRTISAKQNAKTEARSSAIFKSSHWDQPNVLAHIRLNDRTDSDGRRVLFVEEIQSDWAQEGRKSGFSSDSVRPVTSAEMGAFLDKMLDQYIEQQAALGVDRREAELAGIDMKMAGLAAAIGKSAEYEQMRAGRELEQKGVKQIPAAPFVQKTDAWVSLAIKRIIRMAAEEGHDAVAFVTGEQSADRYDLSKTVSEIAYWRDGDEYGITALDMKGGEIHGANQATGDAAWLESTVGKDIAQKIINDEGDANPEVSEFLNYRTGKLNSGVKVIQGEGLKIGGDGMRAFYGDETGGAYGATSKDGKPVAPIVQKVAKEALKKLGGGQMTPLEFGRGGTGVYGVWLGDIGEFHNREFNRLWEAEEFAKQVGGEARQLGGTKKQPGILITDEIREKAMGGMPLFSRSGSGDAKPVEASDDVEEIVQGEIPESVDEKSILSSALSVAKSKTWNTGRQLKVAIQAAVEAAAQAAGVNVSAPSPQSTEYLVRVAVKDALLALEQNPNAVGWYDVKTRQAIAIMALVHPEIATDENAKFAFVWALAVTSNGLKVNKNFELAEQVYRRYKAEKSMPSNVGIGTAKAAINKSLALFNTLEKAWGIDNLRKFMQTNFTVGEITGIDASLKPGGEHADVVVRGASILGPKIGNGFFSNLYGQFSALTMDRWLVRTWGRWTATLIRVMPVQTDVARARLEKALAAALESPADVARMSRLIGKPVEAGMSIDELAQSIAEASMDPDTRAGMNETEIGVEMRKAGNSLAKYLDGQKEAPAGPLERKYIRQVFGRALEELRQTERYKDLTMADFQAVLWYAEKRLYESAKQDLAEDDDVEGYSDDDAPDYANAAADVARKAGVTDRRINIALNKEQRRGRSGDARPGDGEAAVDGVAGKQAEAGGFTRQERKLFIGARAVLRNRSNRAGNQEQPGSYARNGAGGRGEAQPSVKKSLGVTYVATWSIGKSAGNVFRANNLPTPKFLELAPSAQNAEQFRKAISASKLASGNMGAAVYVYSADEYAGMRMFLAEDGASGVAIKPDGDIVSVFSKGGGAGRGVMELAVSAGGKKLDCFDTILPPFYAAHGFRAVARLTWDESQAPSDWDKYGFRNYNGGEPDVVFMVYDPSFMTGLYSWRDGKRFTGDNAYGMALDAQSREMRRVDRAERKRQKEGRNAEREGDGVVLEDINRPDAAGRGRDRGVADGDIPSYGEAREGATSVRGLHYSSGVRTQLDSGRYGTGMRGAESARLANSDDPRIRQRVYFYADSGNGVTPETGVGHHAHAVQLDNIYDATRDPLGLKKSADANAFESAVIDAGFDGYMVPFGRQFGVVLLGQHSVPVSYAGMGKVTFEDRLNTGPAPTRAPDAPTARVSAVTQLRKIARMAAKTGVDSVWPRIEKLIADLERVVEIKADRAMRAGRARGADWLRERLIRARRTGELPSELVDLTLWMIDQNPAIAADLGISIRENGRHVAGNYNPVSRVMTLFASGVNPTTGVHEILHHLERMMSESVQAGVEREWSKAFYSAVQKAMKAGDTKLVAALEVMLGSIAGSVEAQKKTVENFETSVLDYDAHYQLVNPSEFWAVNATRIMARRAEVAGSWVGEARRWLSEFVQKVKGLLGLRSDAPVLRALQEVMSSDGQRVSKKMLNERVSGGKATAYNALNFPAIAKALKPGPLKGMATRTIDRIDRALTPLGSLPKVDDYLAERGIALGKVADADHIGGRLYKAFSKRTEQVQREVYDFLTTAGANPNSISDPDARQEAVIAKDMIIDVGNELVAHGLLDQATMQANQGAYLPRVYLKHLLSDSGWKAIGTGRKPSQLGYLIARENIPQNVRDVILGEIKDPGYLANLAFTRATRDMALLDWLDSISQEDAWVYRKDIVNWQGQRVTAFWLKNEADRIREQIPYYTGPIARQATTLVAQMDAIVNPVLSALDKVPSQYRQMPNTHRYGRLRGMFVRKEIYDDIIGVGARVGEDAGIAERLLGYGGVVTKMTQAWKTAKVALNPPAQIRNFISNAVLLQLSGVPLHMVPVRMAQAISQIRLARKIEEQRRPPTAAEAHKMRHWVVAKKYGITVSTFSSQELMRAERELIDLKARAQGAGWLAHMMNTGAKIAGTAGDIYQFSEALYKTAKIIDEMEGGAAEQEAAAESQKWLFDYSLVSPSIRYLRNAPIGMPFLTFSAKVAPRLLEVALKKPWRFLPWVALAYTMPMLIAAMGGPDEDDQEKIKKLLPESWKDKGHVYVLPVKDDSGRWQVLDLAPLMPWSMFTSAGKQLARGDVQSATQTLGLVGGPLTDLIIAWKTNKDAFSGRDIVQKGDPLSLQLGAMLTYVYNMAMPPIITNRGAIGPDLGDPSHVIGGKFPSAIRGSTNRFGDPVSTVPQATAGAVGLNVRSVDPVLDRGKALQAKQREIFDTKTRLKQALSDRALSPAEKAKTIKMYRDEMIKRQGELKEFAEETQ